MQAARDRLRASPYTIVRSISCACDHGVLVLRGQVPSYYYKQLAQAAVVGVDGVSEVINEITVVSPLA
jgi:osmotically-inducible protein OsmY